MKIQRRVENGSSALTCARQAAFAGAGGEEMLQRLVVQFVPHRRGDGDALGDRERVGDGGGHFADVLHEVGADRHGVVGDLKVADAGRHLLRIQERAVDIQVVVLGVFDPAVAVGFRRVEFAVLFLIAPSVIRS